MKENNLCARRRIKAFCEVISGKIVIVFPMSLRRTHKEHWKKKAKSCNLGIINWIEF